MDLNYIVCPWKSNKGYLVSALLKYKGPKIIHKFIMKSKWPDLLSLIHIAWSYCEKFIIACYSTKSLCLWKDLLLQLTQQIPPFQSPDSILVGNAHFSQSNLISICKSSSTSSVLNIQNPKKTLDYRSKICYKWLSCRLKVH